MHVCMNGYENLLVKIVRHSFICCERMHVKPTKLKNEAIYCLVCNRMIILQRLIEG